MPVYLVIYMMIYMPYRIVYLVISLPKIPYIHCINIYGSGQPYKYEKQATYHS